MSNLMDQVNTLLERRRSRKADVHKIKNSCKIYKKLIQRRKTR